MVFIFLLLPFESNDVPIPFGSTPNKTYQLIKGWGPKNDRKITIFQSRSGQSVTKTLKQFKDTRSIESLAIVISPIGSVSYITKGVILDELSIIPETPICESWITTDSNSIEDKFSEGGIMSYYNKTDNGAVSTDSYDRMYGQTYVWENDERVVYNSDVIDIVRAKLIDYYSYNSEQTTSGDMFHMISYPKVGKISKFIMDTDEYQCAPLGTYLKYHILFPITTLYSDAGICAYAGCVDITR